MDRQTCVVIVEPRPRGGSIIPIAFDPVAAWGDRDEFYVHGTIQGRGVRGSITHDGHRWIMSLGPAWCRDAAVGAGREVLVDLAPEGPQVDDVPSELGELLRADPAARRAFEHLATFYRNGFVRPIAEARRAETRARRAQQVLAALLDGRRAY